MFTAEREHVPARAGGGRHEGVAEERRLGEGPSELLGDLHVEHEELVVGVLLAAELRHHIGEPAERAVGLAAVLRQLRPRADARLDLAELPREGVPRRPARQLAVSGD